MNNNEHGFRVPTDDEDDEWVVVHQGAPTNTNPGSLVEVTINAKRICPNMTNKEFRREAMRARDIGVELIKHRIKALTLWDEKEQDRVKIFFGRADIEIRNTLGARLPRLLRAMQELVPKKIVRIDSKTNRRLSCVPEPDSGLNHAAVCKPDSEKRVIALYSAYCQSPFGMLRGTCKIKTIIHECTHFTDTFNSQDWAYVDKETSLWIYAKNHPEKAIENADSITGYVANFEKVIL